MLCLAEGSLDVTCDGSQQWPDCDLPASVQIINAACHAPDTQPTQLRHTATSKILSCRIIKIVKVVRKGFLTTPKEDRVFRKFLSLAGYDSTALVIVVDDCLEEIVHSAVRHQPASICGLALADFKHK